MAEPTVHDVAPRISAAIRAHRADAPARSAWRRRHLEAERLVAHRELQLVRAQATGDRRYIRRRDNKLELAKSRVRRIHAQRPVEIRKAA